MPVNEIACDSELKWDLLSHEALLLVIQVDTL